MAEEQPDEATEAVLAAAEELYAGPVDAFVPRRTALAKEVAAAHDKATGQRVTRLKKPSTAAWAVNLLVRREAEQIDQVLGLAESLRAAAEALDGAELRALTKQRWQLTTALATTARRRAADAGTRLSEAVVDQVEGVLTAAMLDPVAARVVRTGRVLTAFGATGMSEVDPEAVVAVPEALGRTAVAAAGDDDDDEPAAPPSLTLVHDDGARLREAEEALEEAEQEVEAAESERDEVRASVQDLDARRLQLRGEVDELRRRVAELEDQADEVDDEHEEASAALDDAEHVLAEAREVADRARRAVEELR
ncbi:hypothetical protein [Nocardioides marmoraquaticus]